MGLGFMNKEEGVATVSAVLNRLVSVLIKYKIVLWKGLILHFSVSKFTLSY